MEEEEDDYMYDITGKKKSRMHVLGKTRLSKQEMDDLFLTEE